MKKLRMVVTSVIVLAIVGSAFGFKAKKGAFCIAASGTNCTTYTIGNQKISTNTHDPQLKYVPCWDFNTVACTAANNGLCTATFRLTTD